MVFHVTCDGCEKGTPFYLNRRAPSVKYIHGAPIPLDPCDCSRSTWRSQIKQSSTSTRKPNLVPASSCIFCIMYLRQASALAARRATTVGSVRRLATGKDVKFGVEGRALMLQGVDMLADAVQVGRSTGTTYERSPYLVLVHREGPPLHMFMLRSVSLVDLLVCCA